MIQRHDARSLHFDLRLEVDGVLASWAVPEGRASARERAADGGPHRGSPARVPGLRRRDPEGQYGAGRMTIWDRGTYETELRTDDEWKIVLHGERPRRALPPRPHVPRARRQGLADLPRASRSGRACRPSAGVRHAAPDAGLIRPDPFDDGGLVVRAQVGRLPGAGPDRRRRGAAAVAQRKRPRRGVPGSRRAAPGRSSSRRPSSTPSSSCSTRDGEADFEALQRGTGTAILMAFDLLHEDGRWLTDRPLSERRARLRADPRTRGRGCDPDLRRGRRQGSRALRRRRGAGPRRDRRQADAIRRTGRASARRTGSRSRRAARERS